VRYAYLPRTYWDPPSGLYARVCDGHDGTLHIRTTSGRDRLYRIPKKVLVEAFREVT
jgi:hypothetical protein